MSLRVDHQPVRGAVPYAKYLTETVTPAPEHVLEAIAAGPVSTARISPLGQLAGDLEGRGYSGVETGYGRTYDGHLWVACLTDMPGVAPEMWDWWFAWHSFSSDRYRLWHPEAHRHASLHLPRTARQSAAAGARYRGATSYVDEVLGGQLDQLAIRFVEPASLGVDQTNFDGTVIAGRVGSALAPLDVGYVIHAVRRTPHGSEMRSRFYLGALALRRPHPAGALAALRRGIVLPRRLPFKTEFGAELLRHCAEEMNHLAGFLPELHAEFGHELGGVASAESNSRSRGER